MFGSVATGHFVINPIGATLTPFLLRSPDAVIFRAGRLGQAAQMWSHTAPNANVFQWGVWLVGTVVSGSRTICWITNLLYQNDDHFVFNLPGRPPALLIRRDGMIFCAAISGQAPAQWRHAVRLFEI